MNIESLTDYCGVVRNEKGLLEGLSHLKELEDRQTHISINPDTAGFAGLSHAFYLKASLLAARSTLECALERRESRGAHNRSDYPELDPGKLNFHGLKVMLGIP